jgi:drug/metabolite transporter (DMT)-like permease
MYDSEVGSKMLRRGMPLFYASISLAIGSSVLYHFAQKLIPPGANPIVSVVVTYLVSLVFCGVLLLAQPPREGIRAALTHLNWASYILALAIIGLEVGFLLVYRSGWNIGLAAVLVNVTASLLLVPVGLLYFKDHLNWVNISGILVCVAGLIMLNWRR